MQRAGGTYQEMVGSRMTVCPGNTSVSHMKSSERHQIIHVFKWGCFNGACLFPVSVSVLSKKVNQGRLRMHHDGQWLMKWTSLHATAWWHSALSELIRVKLFILSTWSKVFACSKWMLLAHLYSREMELAGQYFLVLTGDSVSISQQ